MDMIVLPRVAPETAPRAALEAMKGAGRSAVLTEGQRGNKSGTWLYDLDSVLAGVRNRRKHLIEVDGAVAVVTASDQRVETMLERSHSEGTLRDAIQSNLNRLGFAAMHFLDDGAKVAGVAGEVRRTVLNLVPGPRNPSGLTSATLLVTREGAFVERMAGEFAGRALPGVHLAVIATDSERRAGIYEVDPNWCTCNRDSDHMYPHRKHNTGESCPQRCGGTLQCP